MALPYQMTYQHLEIFWSKSATYSYINFFFFVYIISPFRHDLDNILLENLDMRTLQAVFELEALLLTGLLLHESSIFFFGPSPGYRNDQITISLFIAAWP